MPQETIALLVILILIIHFISMGILFIVYENGSAKSPSSSVTADTDVFSIERQGTTITYSKNGTVFYTSLTASSAVDYYIDSSMHDYGSNGYTISNILVVTRSSSDLDGDGIPNSLDLDSDGDGYFDVTCQEEQMQIMMEY